MAADDQVNRLPCRVELLGDPTVDVKPAVAQQDNHIRLLVSVKAVIYGFQLRNRIPKTCAGNRPVGLHFKPLHRDANYRHTNLGTFRLTQLVDLVCVEDGLIRACMARAGNPEVHRQDLHWVGAGNDLPEEPWTQEEVMVANCDRIDAQPMKELQNGSTFGSAVLLHIGVLEPVPGVQQKSILATMLLER